MKICAIICEYNPFHNGHLYQIQAAKRLSGADGVLCLMSGNFVQRGEAALLEKRIRARHALLAGADVVIELPTPFATAPAELFAKGAVHLLSSIPSVSALCFGAERADKQAFLQAATLLNDEPKEISEKIKAGVDAGLSYAKARANAWGNILPQDLLCSPNNILGLEYAKAVLATGANIDILPLQRIGGGYKETTLQEYPSATAIRAAIAQKQKITAGVPDFVQADLPTTAENSLELLERLALLQTPPERLARVCDCTEGLENAFKRAAILPASLEEQLTSARYTSSRIRRIALQNLLGIEEAFIRDCLSSPLYLRILGVKKQAKVLLSLLGEKLPLLVRAHDETSLHGNAKACYERDIFAEKIYALLYPHGQPPKEIFL